MAGLLLVFLFVKGCEARHKVPWPLWVLQDVMNDHQAVHKDP